MATYTDTLTFTDNGASFDLTLTVSGSGGIGTVTAVTGTADGSAITVFNPIFSPQVVSTTYPQFENDGLTFGTANDSYTLYNYDGDLYLIDTSENFDDNLISTDTFTVEANCFLRGTRILTPGGEMAVEDLAVGGMVTTISGDAAEIRWIGQGKILCPPGRRSAATPVIVRRDALDENVPSRDLHITKGHALYLDDALIPAEFLVNHRSIVWDDSAREVEFFHIELPAHEVIVADGAPAESYRDEGNRWMFANANPAWDRPDVAPYAPVLTGGPVVDAIWARLLERSGERLHLPTTTEPDLHLLVDGVRVDCVRHDGNMYVFPLRDGAQSVVIASRAAAQSELGRCRDARRLGVAISHMEFCCGGAGRHVVGAEALSGPGFYGYEPEQGCCWTNGHAVLPATAYAELGAEELRVYVRHTTHYALPEEHRRAA